MSDRKRKMKGKRRKSVRCTLCTPWRWMGNSKEKTRPSDRRRLEILDGSGPDGTQRKENPV